MSLLVAGGRLMAAAPGGPVQDVLAVPDGRRQHEGSQETDELGAGQRDEVGLLLGGLVNGGDCEGEGTAAAIRENSDQRIQEFQQVTWP